MEGKPQIEAPHCDWEQCICFCTFRVTQGRHLEPEKGWGLLLVGSGASRGWGVFSVVASRLWGSVFGGTFPIPALSCALLWV